MSDRPRKTRMPPGYQRQMLVMAISGLSFIVVLALIGLLLHFVGCPFRIRIRHPRSLT